MKLGLEVVGRENQIFDILKEFIDRGFSNEEASMMIGHEVPSEDILKNTENDTIEEENNGS